MHASLTISGVFALYRRVIASPVVDLLSRRYQPKRRNRLYTAGTLFWLMISQRLQPPGSLVQTVARVRRRHLGGLLRPVKKISRRTGGYCRARLRAPVAMIQAISLYLTTRLQQQLTHEDPRFPAGVYLIDGTMLTLASQAELVRNYPPGKNQHGISHWPLLRMVVLHEARTGLAVAPAWGPRTISEQALAERVLNQLPTGALLLGDRNFGVFSMAYGVAQRQCSMILRLTKARAGRLAGQRVVAGSDQRVVWTPTPADRVAHPELPSGARVEGRLVVAQLAGWREPLYLFTTLELAAAEVVELYGLRWNIETDLRSIKQTVRLQHINVKSTDMVDKELWVALAAYNLVRAVLCLAALQFNLHPRELSFTHVFWLVESYLPDLLAKPGSARAERELQRLIREAATCRLPRRKNRRSYPREIWLRRRSYPIRRATATPQSK